MYRRGIFEVVVVVKPWSVRDSSELDPMNRESLC